MQGIPKIRGYQLSQNVLELFVIKTFEIQAQFSIETKSGQDASDVGID